jgi:hypothetical protein
VKGLADGGGAGVADARVSSRRGTDARRTGQLDPALAKDAASRNRAVWYWTATLPFPVRHGDPAGAAQDDMGQSLASTHRKSSLLTSESFHMGAHAQSYATTHETESALDGPRQAAGFIGEHL